MSDETIASAILDPINVLGACVAIALPRWWYVPIAAGVFALVVEAMGARNAMEFGEAFADNFGTGLAPRFAAMLIVMFTVYGLVEWRSLRRKGRAKQ